MNTLWDSLCRACLSSKDSFTHFLFKDISAETYFYCTSIEPQKNESLPTCLCEKCYNLLKSYSQFKRTCIESQATLLGCKTVKAEDIQINEHAEKKDGEIENVEINNPFDLVTKCEEDDLDHCDVLKEELAVDFDEALLIQGELTDRDDYKSPKKKKKRKKHKIANEPTSQVNKEQLNYPCDMCGKKFRYSKRMETHRLSHFNIDVEPNLQCLKCSKSFMTTSGYRRHRESVHARVRLSSVACARCGRVCASKHSLRAHERSHVGPRAHAVCHVCGKRVSSTVILRAHLETHKADRERRHTCEHCGKKFFTNTILLSHIKRLHTGLRYICEICNYPFTDKHNLSKHLLIHEGIKMYKCDICNKSYATNGSLVEHKRIHSGERPFNCSFCSKSFLSKRRLVDHHRTHTGDKPHRCEVCEQRFTQRGTLKRHMKVHDPMKAPMNIT